MILSSPPAQDRFARRRGQSILRRLAVLAALLPGAAWAAIGAGGSILNDTTWAVADSPVSITSDLSVDAGATLTIQAGVTVRVAAGRNITVNAGALRILGEASNPVRITSAKSQGAAPGDWRQLRFLAGTSSGRTVMQYAIIEYGGGVLMNGASPTFNHVGINNHAGPAITLDLASSPLGADNSAAGNGVNGILVPAGDISQPATWGLRGIPYVLQGGALSVGNSPRADRFSPNTLQQGASATFTLSGQRLAGLANPSFDKSGISATVQAGATDSSASLNVAASADAPPGAVRLSGMTDAGRITLGDAFFVIPRLPELTSLTPASVMVGQGDAQLQVIGQRLTSDGQVLVAGVPVSTSFVDSGKALATVPNQSNVGSLSVKWRAPDSHNAGNYFLSNELLLAVQSQPLAFSSNALSLNKNSSQNLSLRLTYPAPAGGLSFSLASSNTAIATVPATLAFPAGSSEQSFAVSAVGVGSANISASRTGFTSTSVAVTATAPPLLGTSPALLAIPPDGLPHSFSVTLDRADGQDHTVTVASGNTGVAVISPASALIAAGQKKATFQVTGKAAGQTSLTLTSAGLDTLSVPIYVATDFQGINTAYSSAVGVTLGSTAPVVNSIAGLSTSPAVGLTLGPAWLNTAPGGFIAGTSGTLTLSGLELPSNLSLTVNPATSVTLGSVSVAADGKSATVPVSVAANAALGLRRIAATGGGKTLLPARADGDRLNILAPPPVVDSVAPLAGTPGSLIQGFTVRGSNLAGAQYLLFSGGGITSDTPPSVSADGSTLTTNVQIAADSAPGLRSVTVHTLSGDSSPSSSAANQFQVAGQLGATYTPIQSPAVGVVLSVPPSQTSSSYGLTSSATGVLLGAGITGRSPATGATGDSVNLVLSGQGLANVSSVSFTPPDGITVGTLVPAADGSTVTVPLTIAASAPLAMRRLDVKAGSTLIPFASAWGNRFTVTAPQPVVGAVAPIVFQTGTSSASLTLTGSNFQNASLVRFTPPDGITAAAPTVDATGTTATTTFAIASSAATGQRVVSIVTPAGETSLSPSAANTVTLAATVGTQYSPLTSAAVGVQFGPVAGSTPAPFAATFVSSAVGVQLGPLSVPVSSSYGQYSPQVGVSLGPMAYGLGSAALRLGESATLVVNGVNLPSGASLSLNPAAGISLTGSPSVSADGSQLSQTLSVVASAATGPRTVVLQNGANRIAFANAGRAVIQVVPTDLPRLDFIAPILGEPGQTLMLTVSGANFGNLVSVSAEPPAGIQFGAGATVSSDGSQISIPLQIAADALPGARTLRVTTLSGASSAQASAANTFTIYLP